MEFEIIKMIKFTLAPKKKKKKTLRYKSYPKKYKMDNSCEMNTFLPYCAVDNPYLGLTVRFFPDE